MILDYFDPSAPDVYQCDVCVIGAGPAGIAIASAFAHSPFSVCVLESGGLESERRTQALNEGESVGPVELDPAMCRLRALGGSSRLWGGGCVPLTRLDMAPRDWVPSSGWPIGFEELVTWSERARPLFDLDNGYGIGDGGFDGTGPGPALPLCTRQAVQRICFISPVLFQCRYRTLLEDAPNITLVLHANLMDLAASDDAGQVQAATIGNLAGRRGTVRARHYVLAAGGIENARLLLHSNGVRRGGLGNDNDQVGRYFMDHPRCVGGRIVDGDFDALLQPYRGQVARKGQALYPVLALADDAQCELGVLNARARPIPVPATPAGLQALRELRATFRRAAPGDGEGVEQEVDRALTAGLPVTLQHAPRDNALRARLALRVGRNAGHVAGAIARRLRRRPVDTYRHAELMIYFEQAPNRESRITLAESRDALNMRRARVDWRFTDLDYASYRTAATVLGHDAARCCNGRFEAEPWVDDPALRPPLVGTAHHIGSTRMAVRPEDGVVDPDCRIHGMDNLHVAGSSVFPTGGWAFPTFTIVALALRLADRLRERLQEPAGYS
ncbi:GMC oxidoreductase [Luteimonas dalianensis]|uniref:GMC oxidoreductase n=1 Tax=Luteimonas dalianensis TaxID=1148196 RepID=UPI003BF04407